MLSSQRDWQLAGEKLAEPAGTAASCPPAGPPRPASPRQAQLRATCWCFVQVVIDVWALYLLALMGLRPV
jgi:hypothetical protein